MKPRETKGWRLYLNSLPAPNRVAERLQMKTLVAIFIVIGSVYAQAQVVYVGDGVTGVVTEYDNGAIGNVINTPVSALAVLGNDLFIGSPDGVSKYDATTGALIDANFISGISVTALTVSGDNLLVGIHPYFALYSALNGALFDHDFMNVGEGNEIAVTALSSNAIFASTTVTSAVGQYSIAGTLLKTNFITLSSPGGAGSLAVLGNNLFLENGSEYNASTGDLINANFDIGGQLAVSGDYLFALNGQNLVEYDITGTVISNHLLGIKPEYLAVVSVPEPSTWMMLSVGLLLGPIFVAERYRQRIGSRG